MVAKLKEPLESAVEQMRKSRQRLPVRRNGKVVAALVPAEDLALLDELEKQDRKDLLAHRRVLALAKKRGEKLVPLAEAKRMLGL